MCVSALKNLDHEEGLDHTVGRIGSNGGGGDGDGDGDDDDDGDDNDDDDT